MVTEAVKALTAEEISELCLRHTLYDWSAQAALKPLVVASAKGVYFHTLDGRRFLDFNSQLMCVNAGYGDRRIIDAIKRQAEQLAYISPFMAHEPRARLGRKLAELLPGDIDKVLFTLGGADANENAIKIARTVTGRPKILARYRSYHGSTGAAMQATGDPRRWTNEYSTGVVHVLDPYHGIQRGTDSADVALAQLEETIQLEGPQTIAAFILEPITGTNGILIPPDGYLQGVRELCDRFGILMICDEVMTGFGRTGRWFAVDHWGVVPDLITLAKGLTSSYVPLGAVGMRPEDRGLFRRSRLLRRLDLQQPPPWLRRGARGDPGLRGRRHGRQRAAHGRGAAEASQEAAGTAPVRGGDAVDRSLRSPGARARPADDGAARAVQRHIAGDEGDRPGAPGRRALHVPPLEHDHDQPAPMHHRGSARRGL